METGAVTQHFEQQIGHRSLSLRSKRFCGVWKQRKTEEGDFWGFVYGEKGGRAKKKKKEREGWGRGRKETLADKPLDIENLRSQANGARDWLI